MRIRAALVVSCSIACAPEVNGDGATVDDTSSSGGEVCPVGAVGCECTQGNGCDAGLQCIVGVCIPDESGSESTGAPLDTGSLDASSSSSDGGPGETGSSESSSSDEGSSSTGVPLPCGNGRLEDEEVCDDGNTEDGDGCNADCQPGGQELWTQTFDGGLQLDDWGHRVAIDADDDVYVAGLAFDVGNTQRDGILVKYDDDGQIQWSERYDSGNGNSSDAFWGVAIAADQSVVVSGWSNDDELNAGQPFVRMYSEDGDALWTYIEDDISDASAYDVGVDSAGDIVVTGIVHDPISGLRQAWLAKLDPADGEPIWNLRFDVPSGAGGIALAIDSSDAVVIGGSFGPSYVSKRDPDGEELWTWSESLGSGGIYGLATGPDDVVAAIGAAQSNPTTLYLARHPAEGIDPEWTDDWSGDLGGGAYGQAVAYDSAGRLATTGAVSSFLGGGAIYVRKYDLDDEQAWLHEEPDAIGLASAVGIAVDSQDRVVVVGRMVDDDGDLDVFVRQLTP